DACHLAHAQAVRAQPRSLLAAIPGIELLSPAEAEICCGSAGIYNLVQPEPAAQLGERKARHIAALKPDIIATGNPGCILQIAAGGEGVRVLRIKGAVPVDGGLPIMMGGKVVGGVGLSGGTSAQDGQCAKAGVDAVS